MLVCPGHEHSMYRNRKHRKISGCSRKGLGNETREGELACHTEDLEDCRTEEIAPACKTVADRTRPHRDQDPRYCRTNPGTCRSGKIYNNRYQGRWVIAIAVAAAMRGAAVTLVSGPTALTLCLFGVSSGQDGEEMRQAVLSSQANRMLS